MSRYENRAAAVTVHLSTTRRDKLRVLSQMNGCGGELAQFVDSLIEAALVKADLQFQLMGSVFGNKETTEIQTDGDYA